MTYDVEAVFTDALKMTKVRKKADYAKYTDAFKEEGWKAFLPVMEAASEDASGAFATFLEDMVECYGGKKGKIKGSDVMTLNYFFIYYIFPTILTEFPDQGDALCTSLKEAYNNRLKENISYTDYDHLYAGFVTKIFGLRFGKE